MLMSDDVVISGVETAEGYLEKGQVEVTFETDGTASAAAIYLENEVDRTPGARRAAAGRPGADPRCRLSAQPSAGTGPAAVRRGERGLTLLEVMAAVALLGLVYTALASKATQGVMSESDSLRRFHASLLADQTLAEIETLAAMRQTPELGNREEESEDGIYVVVNIEVIPWNVPLPPQARGRAAAAPANAGSNVPRTSWPAAAATPGAPAPGVWCGCRGATAFGERSVERVTFVLDHARIRGLAPDDCEGAGS